MKVCRLSDFEIQGRWEYTIQKERGGSVKGPFEMRRCPRAREASSEPKRKKMRSSVRSIKGLVSLTANSCTLSLSVYWPSFRPKTFLIFSPTIRMGFDTKKQWTSTVKFLRFEVDPAPSVIYIWVNYVKSERYFKSQMQASIKYFPLSRHRLRSWKEKLENLNSSSTALRSNWS